jgi:ribosomal-protein-alanine N-acetyltransferase
VKAAPLHYESIEWHAMVPSILTKRLVLRLAGEEDIDSLMRFQARNIDHFRPWFPESALAPSKENLLIAADDKRELARADRGYRFHLFPIAEPGKIIGLCSISDVRRGAIQQAVVGYALDKDYQGKGLMTEAASAAVKFAFDDLDLHRLEGSYMPENAKSGAILQTLGFQKEALIKDYLFLNGRWQDHIVTFLVNETWVGTGRRLV